MVQFQAVDLGDLLTYFQIRRKVLLDVLNNLVADEWSRTVKELGKKRQESVYWKVRTLALHEESHLHDLAHKLE